MVWEHLNVSSISSFTFSPIFLFISALLLGAGAGNTDIRCDLETFTLGLLAPVRDFWASAYWASAAVAGPYPVDLLGSFLGALGCNFPEISACPLFG